MKNKTLVIPKGMEFIKDEIGYAPGVLVNGTLYIAGQIGRNSDRELVVEKEAQFVQVFENLKKILQEVGGGFSDVVEITSYHTDMRDLPLYMRVRDQYFKGEFPAWTAIGAASLCGAPGYFLEIKATAVLG